MTTDDSEDWPPPGWRIEEKVKNGRRTMCYINVKTGLKLYSKLAVIRHLNKGNVNHESPQLVNKESKRGSGKKPIQPVAEDKSPDWLPEGWTIELRTVQSGRKEGRQYKCYVDPSTGSRFYSKPEVSRHLESTNGGVSASNLEREHDTSHKLNNCSTDPARIQSETALNVSKSDEACEVNWCISGEKKVKIEKTIDKELPAGWIKEIRVKNLGNKVRKDAEISKRKSMQMHPHDEFYYDSASEYVFRSKLEVLRYLETGEISRHAFKRKDKADSDAELTEGTISISRHAFKRKDKVDSDAELTEGTISQPCSAKQGRATSSSAKQGRTTRSSARKAQFVGKENPEGIAVSLPKPGGLKVRCSRKPSGIVTPPQIDEEGYSAEEMTGKQGRTTRCSTRKAQFVGKEKPEGSAVSLTKPGGLKIRCSREPSGIVTPPQIDEEGYSAEEMTGKDSPIDENIDLDRLIFTITRDVNLDGQARTLMESFPAAISNEPSAVASCLAGPFPNFTQETEKGTKTERVNSNAGESQAAADLKDVAPASPASENIVQEKIRGDSRGGRDEETPPGIVTDNCVGSEGQSSKRNTRKRKGLILPSRSSKRLAGVEVEPVSNTIPIERALRARSRKSCSETESTSPLVLNSDELHLEKAQQVDDSLETGPAPSICGQADAPEVEDSSNDKNPAEVSAALELKSSNLEDSPNDKKNLVEVSAALKQKSCNLVDSSNVDKNPAEVSAALKQKSSNLEAYPNNKKNLAEVSAALNQKSSKLEDSANDNKNTAEVPAALRHNISNIDESPEDNNNPAEVSAALDQKIFNLEDSANDNKNPAEASVSLEHKSSHLQINGGESVPPESQFCLPSFWSDPCLEFAFKTLTGAMPVAVDDNLESIKEYFQHQLRTSAANDNPAATNGSNLIHDTGVDGNLNIDASAAFASLEKADSLQQSQMQHVTSHPADIGRNSLCPSNLGRK